MGPALPRLPPGRKSPPFFFDKSPAPRGKSQIGGVEIGPLARPMPTEQRLKTTNGPQPAKHKRTRPEACRRAFPKGEQCEKGSRNGGPARGPEASFP